MSLENRRPTKAERKAVQRLAKAKQLETAHRSRRNFLIGAAGVSITAISGAYLTLNQQSSPPTSPIRINQPEIPPVTPTELFEVINTVQSANYGPFLKQSFDTLYQAANTGTLIVGETACPIQPLIIHNDLSEHGSDLFGGASLTKRPDNESLYPTENHHFKIKVARMPDNYPPIEWPIQTYDNIKTDLIPEIFYTQSRNHPLLSQPEQMRTFRRGLLLKELFSLAVFYEKLKDIEDGFRQAQLPTTIRVSNGQAQEIISYTLHQTLANMGLLTFTIDLAGVILTFKTLQQLNPRDALINSLPALQPILKSSFSADPQQAIAEVPNWINTNYQTALEIQNRTSLIGDPNRLPTEFLIPGFFQQKFKLYPWVSNLLHRWWQPPVELVQPEPPSSSPSASLHS